MSAIPFYHKLGYEHKNGQLIYADGQALDANTVLDLIDKYPELAKELSNVAGNANLQKAAIENLFEAKKSDYILTQQSAIDNIKASNNETEAVIENTKKKINIFMSAYREQVLQNLPLYKQH